VATVDIAAAEFDRVRICGMGHDARSKILVVCRDDREIRRVNGGLQNLLVASAEEGLSSFFGSNCAP